MVCCGCWKFDGGFDGGVARGQRLRASALRFGGGLRFLLGKEVMSE